jgi:hypothetical protein
MADEKDLRNALDAVNAGRKWALLGMAALFFAITIALGAVFGMLVPALQPPGPSQQVTIETPAGTPGVANNGLIPLKVLWVSTAVQLFFIACGTIAVILHVSRMTRAVLRAIEATRP